MSGTGGTPPTVAARIDEFIGEAKTQTGLHDFGSDTWREGLEVLVGSAVSEATFSDMGEMGFRRAVVRALTNRLKVEDWHRRHPEIDEQTVEIEFMGVGLPRTGSTAFVHCDMEPAYHYAKRVLKLLQWKTDAKVWRLKCPTHTLFLDAYVKVFPEVRFWQTHRDVSRVLPSVCDLYLTLLKDANPGIDPIYIGELNMGHWSTAMDRLLAFRRDPANDARFFDIGFTEFQADPISQIRRLYDWLGDELTPATVERMRAWRADNPKDKHGTHTYNADQFGITDQALVQRFGAYRDRFAPLLEGSAGQQERRRARESTLPPSASMLSNSP